MGPREKEQLETGATALGLGAAGHYGHQAAFRVADKGFNAPMSAADKKLYNQVLRAAKDEGTRVIRVPGDVGTAFAVPTMPEFMPKEVHEGVAEALEKKHGVPIRPGDVGISGNYRRAEVLAHELGHVQLGKHRLGKYVQNTGTIGMGMLGGNPAVGAGIGAVTSLSDDERIREAGKWAPALMRLPTLGFEAGASLLAHKRLKRLGASPEQLRAARKSLSGAWGTYLADSVTGTAGAHGGSLLGGLVRGAPPESSNDPISKSAALLNEARKTREDAHERRPKDNGVVSQDRPDPTDQAYGDEQEDVKNAEDGSTYAGDGELGGLNFRQESHIPAFRRHALKVAGPAEKRAYAVSQYSGPLSYGRFKMESHIPPFQSPQLKTSGPPSEEGSEKKAASGELIDQLWEDTLLKCAFAPGLVGVMAGYYPGKNVAGETAAALAPEGRVTRSENVARNLAVATAPLGGIAGLVAAKKYNLAGHIGRAAAGHLGLDEIRALQQYGAPLVAGVGGSMLGGLATGVGTGAVQQLRGPLHPKKKDEEKEKKAYDPNVADPKLRKQHEDAFLAHELARSIHGDATLKPALIGTVLGTVVGAAPGFITNRPTLMGAGGALGMVGGAYLGGKVGLRKSPFTVEQLRGMKEEEQRTWEQAYGKYASEKRAYDPSPLNGPGTLGNVDIPGMRKMQTPAKQLDQSKPVAQVKMTPPTVSNAIGIKGLPAVGSKVASDAFVKQALIERLIRLGATDVPKTPRLFMRHRNPEELRKLQDTVEAASVKHVRTPILNKLQPMVNKLPEGKARKAGQWAAEAVADDPIGMIATKPIPIPGAVLAYMGGKRAIERGIDRAFPLPQSLGN